MVRSDARENRDRILHVARRALDEPGTASLNQIAQRAGVGAGTLYRHFPTREDLVLAVYEEEIGELLNTVSELLRVSEPIDALRTWTTALVDAMLKKHALGDAISQTAHQSVAERSYGPVVGAITELLDAGKADGSIRHDAHAADFLMLTGAFWRAATNAEADAARMLELVLDGLRPHRR